MSRVGEIKAERYINRWQTPVRISQPGIVADSRRRTSEHRSSVSHLA